MQRPEIYFKDWCPFSQRALQLLDEKGIDYEAIDVTNDPEREREMQKRAGRTSVPQVFVGALHLGGYDDIALLDRYGKLDPILAGQVDAAA